MDQRRRLLAGYILGFSDQIRPGERQDTATAFLTLFGVMFAHAQLETARDALFLSGIPASRLPVVYLLVAGVALLMALYQTQSKRALSGRSLGGWLMLSALVTATLGLVATANAPWTLYLLYVWSAVAVSSAVTHIFILLGERFTATQAKRLYAFTINGTVHTR